MSKLWPITLILGIVLYVVEGFKYIILHKISIMFVLGTILLISYLVAQIISNIRLAKIFEKGILFTILLVLLPKIFQPILGFQKD